jgi:hypothetical protein
MKITKGLSRLSLHDSRFEHFARNGNNITVIFNWAFLEKAEELGVDEAIVMGRTTINFFGVSFEEFRAENLNHSWSDLNLEESIENWDILTWSKTDDLISVFTLGGLLDTLREGFLPWVEWKLKFESFSLEWDKHITHLDWLSGKELNE